MINLQLLFQNNSTNYNELYILASLNILITFTLAGKNINVNKSICLSVRPCFLNYRKMTLSKREHYDPLREIV